MGSSTPATKKHGFFFRKFHESNCDQPIAVFEGDYVTFDSGSVIVWKLETDGPEIVAITRLMDGESMERCLPVAERKAFVDKARRKKSRRPYDAVRPTKREMAALTEKVN